MAFGPIFKKASDLLEGETDLRPVILTSLF
jgi:hypothetical protein